MAEKTAHEVSALLARIDAALMRAMDQMGKNVMVRTDDLQELRKLAESVKQVEFYKSRCNQLQLAQAVFREPERKAVCDILANCSTSSLLEKIERIREQADRYVWLRKFASDSNQVSGQTPILVWSGDYTVGWNAALDAAVDKAMGKKVDPPIDWLSDPTAVREAWPHPKLEKP
ncbi:hypothetical protein DLP3_079 [Stenotrophomonas phage vB_SmaS_DLP_3]|nr:hypothetical protein DLP3_079 [Stenotrophomonas phage vB_SmaS_DLP_3]